MYEFTATFVMVCMRKPKHYYAISVLLYSCSIASVIVNVTWLCSTENIYSDVSDVPTPFTGANDLQNRHNSDIEHAGLGQRFPSKRGREVNHDWGAKPLNVSLPDLGDGKGSVTDEAGYLSPCQGTPPPGYHELHAKSTPVVRLQPQPAASCKQANLSVESIYLTPISDEEAEELEQEKRAMMKSGKERPWMAGKRNGSFVDDDCYLAPRSCQFEPDDDDGRTEDGYLAPATCRVVVEGDDIGESQASPTTHTSNLTTPNADTPSETTPTTDTPSLPTPGLATHVVDTPSSSNDKSSPSYENTTYAIRETELPAPPPVPTSPVPDT